MNRLKSGKFLDKLVFTGGTMLRLCYGLNRFSVDLVFWLANKFDIDNNYFSKLKDFLIKYYVVRDAANKFYTLIFEINSQHYPRSLKIEIRKKVAKKYELSIAYSKYTNIQVLVKTLPLEELMQTKLEALLDRQEIRDAFDLEFLVKKGIELKTPPEILKKFLRL
ncbi:nucleotidyl transferase AbiEii/AbiGii toxin family protein [Thermodesulfobacterium hveragerdense]|uniref:nucleotidyl transferase AbiEii/AbiGii toxin family protein n=1 Tax=Thermodesulfobacterium hveragerdense TaxID=53424 RepID=UPI00146BBACE|nr:nucleotidyl transferase AbiEii/AbiGii toxin family protein [Thermodesulfobacterium hveragerdense]